MGHSDFDTINLKHWLLSVAQPVRRPWVLLAMAECRSRKANFSLLVGELSGLCRSSFALKGLRANVPSLERSFEIQLLFLNVQILWVKLTFD
jgi:hypothetical protein